MMVSVAFLCNRKNKNNNQPAMMALVITTLSIQPAVVSAVFDIVTAST